MSDTASTDANGQTAADILESVLAGNAVPAVTIPQVSEPLEEMITKLSGIGEPQAEAEAETQEVQAEGETTQETQPEQTATEQQPEQTPKQTDDERLPNRFRFQSPEDQAVALLSKSMGVSLVEAARIYAESNKAVQQAQDSPSLADAIAEKTSRLQEIHQVLDAMAEEAGEVGITMTKEVMALMKERDGLVLEIPELRQQQNEAANAAHQEALGIDAQLEAQVEQLYPDVMKPGTALYEAVKSVVDAGKDKILDLPDRVHLLTVREANRLGIVPATGKASTSAAAAETQAQQAAKTATSTAAQTAKTATQAQPPPAFRAASGNAATAAHRITVDAATPSPRGLFEQGLKQGGSVGAALEAVLMGGVQAPVSRSRF